MKNICGDDNCLHCQAYMKPWHTSSPAPAGREVDTVRLWKNHHATFDTKISHYEFDAIVKAALSTLPTAAGADKAATHTVLSENCPKCGDRLIKNNTGIECGALRCNYHHTPPAKGE